MKRQDDDCVGGKVLEMQVGGKINWRDLEEVFGCGEGHAGGMS